MKLSRKFAVLTATAALAGAGILGTAGTASATGCTGCGPGTYVGANAYQGNANGTISHYTWSGSAWIDRGWYGVTGVVTSTY